MNGMWPTSFLWQQPLRASRLIYIWIPPTGAQSSLILIVPIAQSTTGIEGIIRSLASTLISAYAGKTGADNSVEAALKALI